MKPQLGYDGQQPRREHLHRLTNVFAKNPLYFITCCTADRRRMLAMAESVAIIAEAFRGSAQFHRWVIGRYVIMPDHVHFFARATVGAKPLSAFMRDWKKWTARAFVKDCGIKPPIWQAEFFDHVIRSPQSYSEKWEYVRQNPVRAGLVASPDSWPYTGECEVLRL